MADTVVKDKDEAERQLEERVRRYEMEREEREKAEEERRLKKKLKVNEDLKVALSKQLKEKSELRKGEHQKDEYYMKQWIDMGEQQASKKREEENIMKEKALNNQLHLKE